MSGMDWPGERATRAKCGLPAKSWTQIATGLSNQVTEISAKTTIRKLIAERQFRF